MSDDAIDYETVRLTFEGPLATLVLNQPKSLNAISKQMALEIAAALTETAKPRRKCRGLLITGEGRAFSAGVNLMATRDEVRAGTRKLEVLSGAETVFHPLLRRVHGLNIPVVAGVNGLAVGIGFALALAADYVVAAQSAWFQTPFRNLASAPDSGLTWTLPRIIGVPRAKRLLMRAERIDATTAESWGLIGEVVPDDQLVEKAREAALDLANGATIALGEIKQLIASGQRSDLDSAFEAEAMAVGRTARTKDNVAAVKMFASKDLPIFTGE